jgi:hypothetical protein
MRLPVAAPPSVEVFDVEGIPVSLGNVHGSPFWNTAWDKSEPREFDPGSARRNGAPISWNEFRALVASVRDES